MNGKYAFLNIVLFLSLVFAAHAQSEEKKTITVLKEGEEMVAGQHCFVLSEKDWSFSFLTVLEGKYYYYKDGSKKGPLDKPGDSVLKTCKGESPVALCKRYEDDELFSQMVEVGNDGTENIVHKGRTVGPFKKVWQLSVIPNRSAWYAVVTSADGKLAFISSEGQSQVMEGTPGNICLCPEGGMAYAEAVGTINMADEAAFQKASKNPGALAEDMFKYFIYPIDGDRLGPFDTRKGNISVWFCRSSACNLFYLAEGDLFMNGKGIWHFENAIDRERLYINRDASLIAWWDSGSLVFSDEKTYPAVLAVDVIERAGKQTISWVSLENQKNLVVYSREF